MKKCVSINDAVEGMILTKPVTNDKGMVLCSKGTSLNESLIKRFKEMQISVLYIESGIEMTEEEFIQEKDKIKKRFLNIKSDSILGKLKISLLKNLEEQKETNKE
ncbi:MAG: hypothetical protein KAI43_02815 [Candidatus Aureabacteria bacterium]|nr:hypothetical protein [Candidatus Auribacterota bacterium]